VARVLAYRASEEMIPFYAVSALPFTDRGVDGAGLSALFVVWSLTAFLLEVPSGAWADTVDRRLLLTVAAVVYAAGFLTWTVWQAFPGFLLGFVLWGASSAMMSGTYESLLYDELVQRGRVDAYPRLLGWGHSAALTATLVATAVAGVLIGVGGYALVGWASVGAALLHGVLAATLPVSLAARRPPHEAGETLRAAARYALMLRTGLDEARHHPDVRRVLLLAAAMVGLVAYDEYLPVVARAHGVDAATVPFLVALTVVGQLAGTALVGRTARLPGRLVGAAYAGGAVLVAVGALISPYVGFAAIAVGYGLHNNAMLVGEARLQDAITGPARATVTSVLGLLEELGALAVFGFFAVGSSLLDLPVVLALAGVPLLLVAAGVAPWLPDARAR
jgi:MFS family permease